MKVVTLLSNMVNISLSQAVLYVKKQLKTNEICQEVGISRQCLGYWEHGITQNPHKKQAEAFWKLYNSLIQGTKEDIFKDAIDKLIDEYESKWVGDVELKVEWNKWPEWFVITRLPFLLYDHFYWPNNRKGDRIESKVFYGHYRTKEPTSEMMIDEAIEQASRL